MKTPLKPIFIVLSMAALCPAVNAFQPSDKIVCGTDEKDGIWCTSYGKELGKWVRIPGFLKQVVVRDGQLWGVSSQGDIYYAADINNPQWVLLQGHAKELSEGHGVLCIVDDQDQVWCADKGITTRKPEWAKATGGVTLKFVTLN
jgi:hypothetical protein